MKKLIFAAAAGVIFLASCAQNKEKREDFKDEHSANEMVNEVGDSAVSATDKTAASIDTAAVRIDSSNVKQ